MLTELDHINSMWNPVYAPICSRCQPYLLEFYSHHCFLLRLSGWNFGAFSTEDFGGKEKKRPA